MRMKGECDHQPQDGKHDPVNGAGVLVSGFIAMAAQPAPKFNAAYQGKKEDQAG